MAGHSHSANIAIRKNAVDKKRGALFGKLSRAIMVAARHGGMDPDSNLKLRYAIDKARQYSMPKDNIERAVQKGGGELSGDDFVELLYEGYGQGGVAVLADVITDNRNRTAGEIRKIFEVHGGNLGATGCVAWMFERKGLLIVPKSHVEEDRLIDVALTAGANDVVPVEECFEVTCDPAQFDAVVTALNEAKIALDSSEITRMAANTIELNVESGRKVLALLNALDAHDDVQAVTSNASLPTELLQEAG